MKINENAIRRLGVAAAVVISFLTIVAAAIQIYIGKYYKSDMNMIDAISEVMEGSVNSYSDDNATLFAPADHNIKAAIIFYPGGKVEYTAYTPLMYKLADKGYLCALLKMPGNLAFFDVDAAANIMKQEQERLDFIADLDWYMMGHSLGGVAATSYVEDVLNGKKAVFHGRGPKGEYKGIILCASYPVEDFSDDDIRLLSIYGSHDEVLSRGSYINSMKFWPEDSREYIIQGGNHAYFGSYGEQDGDGEASITNEEQQDITVNVIDEWISEG